MCSEEPYFIDYFDNNSELLEALWLTKGNALGNLGRFEEAIESFDQALAINPNLKIAVDNRNVSLEKLRELSE